MVENKGKLGAPAASQHRATDERSPSSGSSPSRVGIAGAGASKAAHVLPISRAAEIAQAYGYFATQGRDGVFITRRRHGDSIALIRFNATGEIVPYADDYSADDHLVATALSLAIAPPRAALSRARGEGE